MMIQLFAELKLNTEHIAKTRSLTIKLLGDGNKIEDKTRYKYKG